MKVHNKTIYATLGLAMALAGAPFLMPANGQATTDSAATKSLRLTASVNPNPPRVGDNALDVQIVDTAGHPMSGLKLSTRVEMTSMDMGSAHPVVKDMGNGHYQTTANFSMAGPWRVTLRVRGGKATLDFDAGGKSAWKSPTASLAMSDSASTTPHPASMPGMAMDNPPNANVSTSEKSPQVDVGSPSGPGFGPNGPPSASKPEDGMAGMNMSDSAMNGMKMDDGSYHSDMDMKPLKMPQLQEQGTYVATGHENWKARTMFGNNTGMVGMMTQMMVGGSGMEGMKMGAMKMDFGEQNYTEDQDSEDNTANSSGMKAIGGTMPGMQMSGGKSAMDTSATAKSDSETKKTKAADVPTETAAPGTSTPTAAKAPKKIATPLKITGAISNAKNGDNTLTITVTDATGAAVKGAKIAASVAMTSMDMGTSHPAVKEMGVGKYAATVNFSMAGPWRVTVKVTSPTGGQPQKAMFDFNAK